MKHEFSPLEKEMLNVDLTALQKNVDAAKLKIAQAQTAQDVKSEICQIWGKISRYVKGLEIVPVIGKFVAIFVELMDALCGA